MKPLFRLIPIAIAISLAGCSSDQMMLQRKVDYRSGSDNLSNNTLEVPPDLTSPAANPGYTVPERGNSVSAVNTQQPAATAASATAAVGVKTSGSASEIALTDSTKAKMVEAGGQRWLVVQGDPKKLWPEIHQFWLDNGFLLKIDNPQLGIMETDWLENRANLPADWVTKLLRKVADSFISTGELDKFRTRVEPGSQPGTTEIYLSHRGMQEVYKDTGDTDTTRLGSNVSDSKTIWVPRKADPELEAEMLALMLQRFGMTEEQATTVVKKPVNTQVFASLTDDASALKINDNFDRAWRRVGLALDRVGFVVADRDRSKGVYYVHRAAEDIGKEESNSFFSSLAFWQKDDKGNKTPVPKDYEVHLQEGVNQTTLTVTGKDGAAVDPDTRNKLLSALLGQLR
ncbi:outer membrane protein assembly factor BamC [Jeongeupia chitinilytica]|uniref:Lipoprotein n=1 Tax=Jeongeupia chitinilytica TaxID=1041641 RepID=A0ABQ3GWR4_9NEIS|nr:outer membrane protein assembly factor BamC [Jeongeupia chitinilytica]GHD58922.1 lipoprotein [Jeongeupia chitinilytica]